MKAPSALQRGMACLCCRKRKMKCDGARPVCSQCSKAGRGPECEYYEKKRTSRTQLLQAKITKLEARLRELEAEQSADSASSSSLSPQSDDPSLSLHQPGDYAFGFDGSVFNTPELDYDLFLPPTEPFPTLDPDFLAGINDPSDIWPADGGFASISDFLQPGPSASSPSTSSLLCEPTAGPSTNWWENDVFGEHKQILLDIFLAHRHQCAFDVHVGRFKASLLLPGAAKPHPSLVDAIYLLGCFFSRAPAYTELEPHFLRRSLRGIADALQHSDRIVHVLQASCLLAVYFFWHGRTLEGYYHSSIAARLAVGLGLHQIRPREWQQGPYARGAGGNAYAGPSSYSHQHHHSQHQHHDAPAPLKASVPLSPPADDVEHAERVAAFWQIFAVDRAWAVATGLPTALPDDDHPRSRIETGWPTAIPDDPEPTVENGLLQPFVGSHLSGSDELAHLRVKAIALFERTARFSASTKDDPTPPNPPPELERALAQFAGEIAALGRGGPPYRADRAALETLAHAAALQVHRAATAPDAYGRCVWAANAVVAVLRGVADVEVGMLWPVVATCWRAAAEVYMRVLATAQGQQHLALVEQQIDLLVDAMERLGVVFPVSGIYAAKVREDWLATRHTLAGHIL